MQVGLQDVGYLDALGTRFVNIDIYISLWVDDGTTVLSGKDVGTVGDLLYEKVFKQHTLLSWAIFLVLFKKPIQLFASAGWLLLCYNGQ